MIFLFKNFMGLAVMEILAYLEKVSGLGFLKGFELGI